ncbi:hypothetical protein ERJ75_000464100 [Trypanosoma vivax]|uniref:Uncharacterized protein n=1 Tax=Trypanosoma vivax (strain Y486) TaxID=1055687 RepID=G0U590_TRYVY|nr:hypothetical protein TRVL_04006 [Trypanosoma vivax]KAH8616550.1 hypothetical protein ERJ75_000464100 [Trypanosoma vivax]CCC51038.1 conserved hypothetical protein [Trypanosoma vivax Y486]
MSNRLVARDGASGAIPSCISAQHSHQVATSQSASASRQQLQSQSHHQQTQQQQQQSELNDDHMYLRRHCIPSKVECIFSSVLSERPEDPLLYIVEHLRNNGTCSVSNSSHNTTIVKDPPKESSLSNSLVVDGREQHISLPVHGLLRGEDVALESISRSTKNSSSNNGSGSCGGSNSVGSNSNNNSNNPVANEDASMRLPGVVAVDSRHRGAPYDGTGNPSGATPTVNVDGGATPTIVDAEPPTPVTPTQFDQNSFVFGSMLAMTPTPPAPPDVGPTGTLTSVSSTRTNMCAVRPSSVRSSRHDIFHGTSSIRFNNVAEALYSGSGSGGVSNTLDREDTRSDLSVCSVASVDMQDFLQEFRNAKADCVGLEAKVVSLEGLSEILKRVRAPVPDIALVLELFDDVRRVALFSYRGDDFGAYGCKGDLCASRDQAGDMTASAAGQEEKLPECVNFDAFLARMAYMIQGRYPMEVLRSTFYALMEQPARNDLALANGAQPQQLRTVQQPGIPICEGAQFPMPTCASATSQLSQAAGKSDGRDASNASLPNSDHVRPCFSQAAETLPLLSGVSLSICVEEGLWRGLGIPASAAEVDTALQTLGIPINEDYKCHVNDFVRLVCTLTGTPSPALLDDRQVPWGQSLFGRENPFLQSHLE